MGIEKTKDGLVYTTSNFSPEGVRAGFLDGSEVFVSREKVLELFDILRSYMDQFGAVDPAGRGVDWPVEGVAARRKIRPLSIAEGDV